MRLVPTPGYLGCLVFSGQERSIVFPDGGLSAADRWFPNDYGFRTGGVGRILRA